MNILKKIVRQVAISLLTVAIFFGAWFGSIALGGVNIAKAQDGKPVPSAPTLTRLGGTGTSTDIMRYSYTIGGMYYDVYYYDFTSRGGVFVVNRTKEVLEVQTKRQEIILNQLNIQIAQHTLLRLRNEEDNKPVPLFTTPPPKIKR